MKPHTAGRRNATARWQRERRRSASITQQRTIARLVHLYLEARERLTLALRQRNAFWRRRMRLELDDAWSRLYAVAGSRWARHVLLAARVRKRSTSNGRPTNGAI